MKQAIAISCICFSACMILCSCGEKNGSSSGTGSKPNSSSAVTAAVSAEKDTSTSVTVTDDIEFMNPENGDVEENGVMPDGTSPLEKIPEIIETAAEDAGDMVSDVIDDLT